MESQPEFRHPEKPYLPGYTGERGAGVVLIFWGVLTMGSTCPFGTVLCLEWLRDPRRIPAHRVWDIGALVFGILGSAWWIFFTTSMSLPTGYRGGVLGFYFIPYWFAFGIWLISRELVRWREIRRLRRLERKHLSMLAEKPVS